MDAYHQARGRLPSPTHYPESHPLDSALWRATANESFCYELSGQLNTRQLTTLLGARSWIPAEQLFLADFS